MESGRSARKTTVSATAEPQQPEHEGNAENGSEASQDPTAGIKELDGWKADRADIPGPWRIFYPLSLKDTVGLYPNVNIRPSVLFCDITGAVTGPEHPDSGKGSFLLDAGDSVDIDDGESFVHNRKFATVLLSGKNFSNIRLVLLGRMFYSKTYVLNELKGVVRMRSAMFVGQAFVESYVCATAKQHMPSQRNPSVTEALHRIKRRITVVGATAARRIRSQLDRQGNEVDPLTWELQPLNAPGSPFRWMHGTDKWKLLGPCTAYRVLGPGVHIPHKPMIYDKYRMADLYNMVDPLKLNKTPYTALEKIEEETRRVIDAVFEPTDKPMNEFRVTDRDYLNQLYEEVSGQHARTSSHCS
ncbi:hypothetical protein, conserved [Babesia bigemina]|uniref:Uncharacterized protein n=1 Tax=Babesia bigemina TaxID=5866 RepID=A0A061D9J4_BABBI|nr:hypothetical protein, conserved [Babesia bigemina]CDR94390.1 hypothetical protein, conserved [Babesia bigemina]|eukprot:XP_012766576.1 hypothetical protein, conserved [Babesia bigemina]